jgi:hypothetical protein
MLLPLTRMPGGGKAGPNPRIRVGKDARRAPLTSWHKFGISRLPMESLVLAPGLVRVEKGARTSRSRALRRLPGQRPPHGQPAAALSDRGATRIRTWRTGRLLQRVETGQCNRSRHQGKAGPGLLLVVVLLAFGPRRGGSARVHQFETA